MMKSVVWSLLFCLGCLPGKSQTEKSLLWKISGKGLQHPSYLYGTFHLMCPGDLVVSDTIRAKFVETKQLYMELDMSDPSIQLQTLKWMNLPEQLSLHSLVEKKDYDSAAAIFSRKTGLSFQLLDKVKPFFITALLYPAMMGCTPEGWETVFTDMAKKQQVPVKGLETVAFQMSLFDSIPYREQAQELVQTLYHFDSAQTSGRRLVQLYKQKNLGALYRETIKDTGFHRYEEALLHKRNTSWIPQLTTAIAQTPCFIAVGAAHLAGEKGLISLLRKKGYHVTPVYY